MAIICLLHSGQRSDPLQFNGSHNFEFLFTIPFLERRYSYENTFTSFPYMFIYVFNDFIIDSLLITTITMKVTRI